MAEFSDLPNELIIEIFKNMTGCEILTNILLINKTTNQLLKSNTIWREICKREIPSATELESSVKLWPKSCIIPNTDNLMKYYSEIKSSISNLTIIYEEGDYRSEQILIKKNVTNTELYHFIEDNIQTNLYSYSLYLKNGSEEEKELDEDHEYIIAPRNHTAYHTEHYTAKNGGPHRIRNGSTLRMVDTG